MRVISHRGVRPEGVHENTLEAFARAVEVGVDGIETDVRVSRDGQLVLLHDRVLAGGQPVASLGRRELEEVLGHSVPVLEEAITSWPDLLWNIEIKSPDALDRTLACLRGRKLPGGVLLTSFRHDVVAAVAERTTLPCGILVTHRPLSSALLLAGWEGSAAMRTVGWDYDFHDPRILEQTKSAGYANFVFGVKTPAEHRECLALPLTGVITDEPQLLMEWRGAAADRGRGPILP